jgi:hypothetical protein
MFCFITLNKADQTVNNQLIFRLNYFILYFLFIYVMKFHRAYCSQGSS